MTSETVEQYQNRCTAALGISASNEMIVIGWCYANPPRKPIPKANGERTRQIYVSRKVFSCLMAVRGGNDNDRVSADAIADALLSESLKQCAPGVFEFYDEHEQKESKLLAELKRPEPTLQPQEQTP